MRMISSTWNLRAQPTLILNWTSPKEISQETRNTTSRQQSEVDGELQIIEEVIGKDSAVFMTNGSLVPVLTNANLDSDLNCYLQPKPKVMMSDQWTQVGAADDSMIRLLREAKANMNENSDWEFINYTPHQISTWDRDYQNHIWAVDRRIFGVTEDPDIHTFRLPRKQVPPSPATVRDALCDKILNNRRNLPEDELLATLRSRGLGQNPSQRLHTWDEVGTTFTKAGTPYQWDPPRNYECLLQELQDKSLQHENQVADNDL